MAGKSKYLEQKILNHVLRNASYTPPTTLYLALFTVDPTDAGTGTEVTGGSYARQTVAFNAPAASGVSTSTNSADVLFPVASAAWGTVTHWGIFDAATAGNLLYLGALTPNKAVASADQIKIAAGTLSVTED